MIDCNSFVSGMLVCSILDVLFSMASYFLEKAFDVKIERKQKKKDNKKGSDDE